ncbi:MAG: fumarate hydratase [Candidatus Cloacimonadota bacterium]|nr:fumarate hydratase [Candidatus Cloacimonadota bacterium]
MRTIDVKILTQKVAELCQNSNYYIDPQVIEKIHFFRKHETSKLAKDILDTLLENYQLAAEKKLPICQDTGLANIFVEVGSEIHFVNGDANQAIQNGVKQGYKQGYLRKSVVSDPLFLRKNTQDNTPALIYWEIVPGNKIKLTVAPKGAGSENMSQIAMLKPTDGVRCVKNFVLKTIKEAGGNPCPPIIVGIGIGGSFDKAALLSKKALLLPLQKNNKDPKFAALETQLLEDINQLGIGPQGFGGFTTALKVNILQQPCHIASLPVAVNIQCHVHRHQTVEI